MNLHKYILGLAIAIAPFTSGSRAADFQVLHSFNYPPHDGIYPSAGVVIDAKGNIFGTTYEGGTGPNYGTVFKIAPNGKEKLVYSFGESTSDGAYPVSQLLLRSGSLFGTNYGFSESIFRLTKRGIETILFNFTDTSLGYIPYDGVIADSGGNLYGANYQGGFYGKGTVFKLAPDKTLSVLHEFSGSDGANPGGPLLLDNAGNLYGMTYSGGALNFGLVYKLAPNGAYTVLHAFAGPASNGGDGANPLGGLVMDAAGNLYGTTSKGGLFDDFGTVFKITPGGIETVLHVFYSMYGPGDGANPLAGLIIDKRGDLYGTTSAGGLETNCPGQIIVGTGCGTVFKLSASGQMTILHAFLGSDGAKPMGRLATDKSSRLYGTTYYGGISNLGTVFRLTK